MTTWTDGFVETSGMTMHYTRTGGDKPQVVLCHGFSDSGECWTSLAPQVERVHIPEVGHHIRYAAPQPFTQAVQAFLHKVF